MPRRRRQKKIVMTPQQAQGFFSNLAKKALKAALPLIKKEAKKALPKLGQLAKKEGLKRARKTKYGKKLGIGSKRRGKGLKLAGGRRKTKRRKAAVRVVMI